MTQLSKNWSGWQFAALAGCMILAGCCSSGGGGWSNFRNGRDYSIPEILPLGSVVRSHYHTMQTNGEATNFILHRHEFVENTAELTPTGKDHVMEIAARMRSAPFPVVVEREDHNSDPELDQFRRNLVAQILTDMGNPDAQQRTFVAPAYGKGRNSMEAEVDYYNFTFTRGGRNGNNNGNNGGGNGGGGGGGRF